MWLRALLPNGQLNEVETISKGRKTLWRGFRVHGRDFVSCSTKSTRRAPEMF